MDGLDKLVQDPITGLHVPIISRRQVLPYDDVDALGWGSTPAQISPDLLSAFAVLVGQSGQQGKLINATKYGFLETAAQVNYTAKAAADAALGATTLRIDDPVFGASDTPVWILPSPANPNPLHGPYFLNAEPDPHLVDLGQGLVVAVKVDDVVMAVPQVSLMGASNKVNPVTRLIQTALGVVVPYDSDVMATTTVNGHRRLAVDPVRSVDWSSTTGLVAPGIATLSIGPFGVGFRTVLHWAKWAVLNNSGAAQTPVTQVWDGPSGTGTLKYSSILAMPAAQSRDHDDLIDGEIKGSDNTVMTLNFDRGGANVFELISAGGYIEG